MALSNADAPGKALVTGAGGFLGACIVERLAQSGWRVAAVARSTRLPDDLHVYRNVDHIRIDLTTQALPESDWDLIIHCAAAIPHRVQGDDAVFSDNISMGETALSAALASGAVLVNMSSMSAFGPISGAEVTEMTAAAPQDAYGRAKRATEESISKAAHENASLRAISLRLPGMVGARSYGNFMSTLADKLIAGESAIVQNPDGRFNNIVYGYDLAEFLADNALSLPGGHRILTIGADQEMSVGDVVQMVAKTAGREISAMKFESSPRTPFVIRFEEIKRLGYRPASVAASIERFVRDKVRLSFAGN